MPNRSISPTMLRHPLTRVALAVALLPLGANAQTFAPLDFSQNVQATNAIYPNNSTLGPEYYSGLVFDFLNVTTQDGQSIDARVTVLGSEGSYEFVGWLPGYNSTAGQPCGDLGVYYRHTNDFTEPTGGIAYTISFYQGGGAFETAATLTDVGFLIYDHDGESGQTESIRVYESDGFSGYQIGDGSGISTLDEGGTWRFDAGNANQPETTADGGFIAYYHNTSSIRFDLFATTYPSNPTGNNGIFAAFDGDLSLLGGDPSNYGSYVAVPEPHAAALMVLAGAVLIGRRRR